jgi:putative MATE family efflux protein
MKKTISLTEGAPWKGILLFALPIALGSVLQQLYNTVDTIAVGNFQGQDALSAVGACAFLTALYLAVALGFSLGSGVLAAQFYGAKDRNNLKKCFATSILLLGGMGLVMTVFALLTNSLWLRYLIAVPESLYDMALLYINVYVAGLFFQFVYNIIAALLRALGDSKASLYFLLISSVVNIVLDILLIGYFHMGVAGAAIATNISQLLAMAASIFYMNWKYPELRISKENLKFDRQMAGNILRTGFPMAIQQAIVSCGFMFIQRLVNSYGPAMTASYTVAMRIEFYVLIPTQALQATLATFSGQNWGAGNIKRILSGLKQTIIMACLISAAFCLATYIFTASLIQIFGISGEAVEYCTRHVHTACFAIMLFSVYFPCLGLYQGVGKGYFATIIATTVLFSRVVLAYSMSSVFWIDSAALWWCEPFSYMIVIVINYIYFFRGRWKQNIKAEYI